MRELTPEEISMIGGGMFQNGSLSPYGVFGIPAGQIGRGAYTGHPVGQFIQPSQPVGLPPLLALAVDRMEGRKPQGNNGQAPTGTTGFLSFGTGM